MEELAELEKAIQASEQLRQKALAQKDIYEQQLKETEAELQALGTTSEEAEEELKRIEKQIEENLSKIKSMIPYDLLRLHKYI